MEFYRDQLLSISEKNSKAAFLRSLYFEEIKNTIFSINTVVSYDVIVIFQKVIVLEVGKPRLSFLQQTAFLR